MQQTEENLTTGTGLPENAFRELGADESYAPVMHPAHDRKRSDPLFRGDGIVDGRDFLGGSRLFEPEGRAGV